MAHVYSTIGLFDKEVELLLNDAPLLTLTKAPTRWRAPIRYSCIMRSRQATWSADLLHSTGS